MSGGGHKSIRLGELLVEEKAITSDELRLALDESRQKRVPLGRILLERGSIGNEELRRILAQQKNLRLVSLKEYVPDRTAVECVDVRLAEKYGIVPLHVREGVLTLAAAEPLDLQTSDDLAVLLGCRFETVIAPDEDVRQALCAAYGIGADTIQGIINNGRAVFSVADDSGFRTETIGEVTDEASIVKFINQILLEAYRSRATDIHIEPLAAELRLRLRVDGMLYRLPAPPKLKDLQPEIVSRIKILSRLNIAERRLPQDGRCKIKIGDSEIDLRISILPSIHGETVNIRFLSQSSVVSGLATLGMSEAQVGLIEDIILKPHGMLLATGPTGSGKTTTLYSCLNRINTLDRKIVTVEDPVEYQLSGITQIQVNPKAGLTFSRGLRSMLRHDPDVMMVGEIRDSETAQVAIQVALTGHLLFSSVHTNDSASTVVRLINMGVEPYLVASSVECVIAQRLVRLICTKCKEELEISRTANTDLMNGEAALATSYVGRGCHNCNGTGYSGRTGIFEIMPMTDEIRDAAIRRLPTREIKRIAMNNGMTTLRREGLAKAKAGLTSIEEVLRVTQESI